MTESIEYAVIGAGVVGLAIARALAIAGKDVIVLEETDATGTVTSARNSEVIHAGLYYPTGSMKARLCVRGKNMLYDYLSSRGINHERCGKIVVAKNDEEIGLLRALEKTAQKNGVDGIRRLTGEDARSLEPNLTCEAAILSPTTGIFDTHAYMLSLQGEAESMGAVFVLLSPVTGGRATDDGVILSVGGADPMELTCRHVVNSSGLGAQAIAASIEGFPAETIPQRFLAKGNYFNFNGKMPFQHLVYPVPGTASLGLHYTHDLGGQGRFGPDVEWVDEIEYTVDPKRVDLFTHSIKRYWPGLDETALQPAYSGIRPKIQPPGTPAMDFIIQGKSVHGVDGLVNLYGIESPGLTSSLAIAEEVLSLF